MSVPEFSVKRPVFIGMCASIVVILGGVALKSLPVDLMPEITYPAISINLHTRTPALKRSNS